ncbi:hypothetical protein GGR51DRAFT_488723 [Nemania sp. FL0031]|nr:hypothetical protein GGR51DRAFT_488723 [Nemania sp. FL0031]
MTTHVNAQGRPTLAPLWTNYESLGRPSATAFRAAQAPLLSPSPMSPGTLPKSMYPASLDGPARKKNRGLLDIQKTSPSSISSPKPRFPIEGQSPLVSKLEKSLQLVDAINSPSAAEEDLGEAQARRTFRPREEYGNRTTADAFVIARSIRRGNSPTSTDGLRPFWEADSSKSSLSRRLTLRAIIRPRAQGRNTFLIQRSLDIDELRATTSTGPSDKSHQGTSPSRASRKPLPVPAKWSSSSRRLSTALSSPQAERFSRKTPHSPGYDKLIRDPKAIPIHTHYASSSLPALAALLTSGHIHSGDVIYLPVPHAESWPQTVRYVYTGEGELTAAMRENILYLGGRV